MTKSKVIDKKEYFQKQNPKALFTMIKHEGIELLQ